MTTGDNFSEQLSFEYEIGFFEHYLQAMERFFDEQDDEYRANLEDIRSDETLSSKSAEFRADYERWRLNALDWHKTLLRRSFFVSIYSFLEVRLKKECMSHGGNPFQALSQGDGGNNLDKARVFFEEVAKLRFPSDTPEWDEVQFYRLLRNCIVHDMGELDDNRDFRLRRYVEKKRQVLSLYGGEIYMESGFCEQAYSTIRDFLCLLLFGRKGTI